MNNRIVIVGAFHEIIELAEENDFSIFGLIDNQKKNMYRGYKILCDDKGAIEILNLIKKFSLVISPDQPSVRLKLYNYYKKLGFEFISIISNKADISKSCKISEGSIIQRGVNISAESKIGKFAKLNTKCNVMHDSVIGDFTTIAPNAVILGNVKIGTGCYIGANATINPNIIISDNTIIGAGAVVTKDCKESGTYVGVPAKRQK